MPDAPRPTSCCGTSGQARQDAWVPGTAGGGLLPGAGRGGALGLVGREHRQRAAGGRDDRGDQAGRDQTGGTRHGARPFRRLLLARG